MQRLPISKPMSSRQNYGTVNRAKAQLTVVTAFRRKWNPKTPRSGLRAVCPAAFLSTNASARELGYANTRAGVNDVQREYHDAIRVRPIGDGEWKLLENDAADALVPRRAGKWESQSARSGFLDCSGETRSLIWLNLIVVGDLCKKLFARRRDKARSFHRVLRLASAKTSSAAKAWRSPRS